MKMALHMILYCLLALVGLVLLLAGVFGALGSRLPVEHVSSGSITLAKPQAEVFALINDMEKFPSWCTDFTKMERLADTPAGSAAPQETWRQFMGRNSFVTVNTVYEPPRRVVRTVDDDAKMFSGSWDHVVEPAPGGCTLTITEHGKVPGAIPRALMHYVFGEDLTIKKFLKAVKAKTG